MLNSNFPVSKNYTNLPQQKKVLAVSNPFQVKIIKSSRALSFQSKIKKKERREKTSQTSDTGYLFRTLIIT